MKKNNFFIQMLTCYKNIVQVENYWKQSMWFLQMLIKKKKKMLKSNFLKLKFWPF